jgi:alpha-beta hydrolase superfamily lysophospholipase
MPARALARLAAAVAGFEALRLGPTTPSPGLRALVFGRAERAFEPRRSAFDWLSRDPLEVDAYCADPQCGFALVPRSMREMFAALARLERPEDLARLPRGLPIRVFAGDADPLSGASAVARLAGRYHRAGLSRVSWQVYAGARHETLNELNRQEVEADLLGWLETCNDPAAA